MAFCKNLKVKELKLSIMEKDFKPNITLFHCINAFHDKSSSLIADRDDFDVKIVKMACSSMVKDAFILKAFEVGADAVVVLVCPEGMCRYMEGNIRAKKRIAWVKKILDEIEINGRRLSIFNISAGDDGALGEVIQKTLNDLAELGPNTAS